MWDFAQGEVLAFDKPLHWTSFDLVAKVRYNLCKKLGTKKLKVGHTGTLDPLATGVVVICTGRKTKLIDQLQYDVKEYIATLIDQTYPTEHITRELIDRTIPLFKGEQWQTPPAFSAIQINGKRAYEFARKGEEVELKPRLLVIDEIEILNFDEEKMLLTIRVVCSKGTYIRALARDIGERLNSGAHLTALRRTRVGETRVEDCYTIEQFLEKLNAEN